MYKGRFISAFLLLTFFNVSGQEVFQKVLNGPLDQLGYDIVQTTDTGYVVVGTSGIPFMQTEGFITKLNRDGNISWTTTIGNGLNYVIQTTNGDYVAAASVFISPNNADILLVKLNANGDTLWTKTYGDSLNNGPRSFSLLSDGGFLITSFSNNSGLMIRTDDAGVIEWSTKITIPGILTLTCAAETPDHGFMIGGTIINNGADGMIFHVDSAGTILWVKKYDIGYNDLIDCVTRTSDNNYVFGGTTANNITVKMYLHKIDENANEIWLKSYQAGYGSDNRCRKVIETKDYGLGITGLHDSSIDDGVYLMKTDNLGNYLWSTRFGDANYNEAYSLAQTFDNGYILTGGTQIFTGQWQFDAYIIKTDSTGYSPCYQNLISVFDSNFTFIATNVSPITAAGIIEQYAQLSVGNFITDSLLCFSYSGIEFIPSKDKLSVYPNPANNFIAIESSDSIEGTVLIYDGRGKLLKTEKFNSTSRIEIKDLRSGLYFYRVITENTHQFAGKFLVVKE
jgi:hypothetical protein